MSKAEDLANEIYKGDTPITRLRRKDYCDGYHQAEKDNDLTWEDIPKILSICENLKTSWWFRDNEQTKQIGKQPFWEEVLRRFIKERKENG